MLIRRRLRSYSAMLFGSRLIRRFVLLSYPLYLTLFRTDDWFIDSEKIMVIPDDQQAAFSHGSDRKGTLIKVQDATNAP